MSGNGIVNTAAAWFIGKEIFEKDFGGDEQKLDGFMMGAARFFVWLMLTPWALNEIFWSDPRSGPGTFWGVVWMIAFGIRWPLRALLRSAIAAEQAQKS